MLIASAAIGSHNTTVTVTFKREIRNFDGRGAQAAVGISAANIWSLFA
jgi:hypothetical protein